MAYGFGVGDADVQLPSQPMSVGCSTGSLSYCSIAINAAAIVSPANFAEPEFTDPGNNRTQCIARPFLCLFVQFVKFHRALQIEKGHALAQPRIGAEYDLAVYSRL